MATAALLACVTPTDACGCSSPLAIGIIAGVVQRSSGAAVPGAVVRAEFPTPGCTTRMHPFQVGLGVAVAGADGSYRQDLKGEIATDSACIRLTAVDAGGGRHDSVTVDGIRMRLSYPAASRPDSLRVDIIFP